MATCHRSLFLTFFCPVLNFPEYIVYPPREYKSLPVLGPNRAYTVFREKAHRTACAAPESARFQNPRRYDRNLEER